VTSALRACPRLNARHSWAFRLGAAFCDARSSRESGDVYGLSSRSLLGTFGAPPLAKDASLEPFEPREAVI
jgi:hypothetical protein